jgi:predicted Zn-dependent protease
MHALKLAVALGLILPLAACGGADARKARHVEKGQAFMAAGSFEKARLEFRNALQIEPDNANLRFLAGEAAEKASNLHEAMQMYQGAIDDDAKQLKARASLARLYVLAGMPDKALAIVEPGIVMAPADADLLAVRGIVRMRKGDEAGARTDGEKAVQIAPGNENAVALLAALYQRGGRTDAAMALVERALRETPRSIDLHLMLAQMLMANQRKADAERQLREVIRLEPGRLAYRYRLAQLQVELADIAGAEATLRAGIALKPEEVEAKLALVNLLEAHRSVEAATRELQAASDHAPQDLELRLALADFHARHGDGRRADVLYREIAASDAAGPRGLAARNRIAATQLRSGNLKDAEVLLREVLTANPHDQEALQMRADLALLRKDAGAAIADLRTLLRDQPNSLPLRRTLARAYVQNKQPALAEDTLRDALRDKPNLLLAELAALYERMGRTDDAIQQYEQLYAKNPASVVAANNLAMMLVTYRSDPKSFERAAVLSQPFANADNAALLDTYGWVLFKQGKTAEAVVVLQRAVGRAPDSPSLLYHLGMAQLAAGQEGPGRKNIESAIASNALFPGLEEARAVLTRPVQ